MKFLWIVLIALALFALALLFSVARPQAPEPLPSSRGPDQTAPLLAGLPEPRPATSNAPDGSERLLQQLEKILTRLERLESSVREVRTEVSIRSEERSRIAVSPSPSSAHSRLDDEDQATLRTLIREGLLNEAWKQRQAELVGIGRHLALQFQLEGRYVAPMIEVLCVDGLSLFNLERELAEQNNDAGMARRRQSDFKAARRRLREDLGETLRNEDLAARVFLRVVSGAELAVADLGHERLLAVEKDWLR